MEENKQEDNSAAPKVDIREYKDLGGLSDKKLNFGLWIVEHKNLFRRILITLLLIIGGVSWSYTIYGFSYYFAIGQYDDEKIVNDLLAINTIEHNYLVDLSAQDLIYSPVQILKTTSDKYDLIVQIQNPNKNHWASIEYCWTLNEKEITCGEDFILSEETKHILGLSQDFTNRPSGIKLTFKNVDWQRINKHKFSDWENYKNERINFQVNDISFQAGQTSGLSDKINLNTLNFTFDNNTPYNYWEVDLNIFLHRGSAIISVNKYRLEEFMSKESREVDMTWVGTTSGVTEIKIIPSVNILKDEIYIDYDGGIGEEK